MVRDEAVWDAMSSIFHGDEDEDENIVTDMQDQTQ